MSMTHGVTTTIDPTFRLGNGIKGFQNANKYLLQSMVDNGIPLPAQFQNQPSTQPGGQYATDNFEKAIKMFYLSGTAAAGEDALHMCFDTTVAFRDHIIVQRGPVGGHTEVVAEKTAASQSTMMAKVKQTNKFKGARDVQFDLDHHRRVPAQAMKDTLTTIAHDVNGLNNDMLRRMYQIVLAEALYAPEVQQQSHRDQYKHVKDPKYQILQAERDYQTDLGGCLNKDPNPYGTIANFLLRECNIQINTETLILLPDHTLGKDLDGGVIQYAAKGFKHEDVHCTIDHPVNTLSGYPKWYYALATRIEKDRTDLEKRPIAESPLENNYMIAKHYPTPKIQIVGADMGDAAVDTEKGKNTTLGKILERHNLKSIPKGFFYFEPFFVCDLEKETWVEIELNSVMSELQEYRGKDGYKDYLEAGIGKPMDSTQSDIDLTIVKATKEYKFEMVLYRPGLVLRCADGIVVEHFRERGGEDNPLTPGFLMVNVNDVDSEYGNRTGLLKFRTERGVLINRKEGFIRFPALSTIGLLGGGGVKYRNGTNPIDTDIPDLMVGLKEVHTPLGGIDDDPIFKATIGKMLASMRNMSTTTPAATVQVPVQQQHVNQFVVPEYSSMGSVAVENQHGNKVLIHKSTGLTRDSETPETVRRLKGQMYRPSHTAAKGDYYSI